MSENMGFLSLFKTDKATEEKGIELVFGESKFFVKRAGKSNKAFTLAVSAYHKKNKFQIENELITDEQATPELAKIYFDTVSIGWENVIYPPTGEVLEYTRDNFIKIMVEYPEFFDTYAEQCKLRTNFQAKATEADSKN